MRNEMQAKDRKKKFHKKAAVITLIAAPVALIATALMLFTIMHAAETALPVGSVTEIRDALKVNEHASMYLTNNLDMSGYDAIISESFKGTLDGDGYSVVNMSQSNVLFDMVDGGTVKNLAIENCKISGNLINTMQNGAELSNIRLLAYSQVAYEANAEGSGIAANTQKIDERVAMKSLVGNVTDSNVYSIMNFGGSLTGNMIGVMKNSTLSNVLFSKEDKAVPGLVGSSIATYSGVAPTMNGPLVGGLSGVNTVKNVWLEGVEGMTAAGDIAAVFGGNTSENGTLTASDITVKSTTVKSTGGKAAGIAVGLAAGSASFTRIETDTCTITGSTGASGWFAAAPAKTVSVDTSRVVSSAVATSSGTANGFAPGGITVKNSYIADTKPSGGTPYMAGESCTAVTESVYEDKGVAVTKTGALAGLTAETAASLKGGETVAKLGHDGWGYLPDRFPYPLISIKSLQDWDDHLLMVSNNARRGNRTGLGGWELRNQVYGPDFSMRRSYILDCAGDTLDFTNMRGMVQFTYGASEVGSGNHSGLGSGSRNELSAQGFRTITGMLDGNNKVIQNTTYTLLGYMANGGVRDLGMTNTSITYTADNHSGTLARWSYNSVFKNIFIEGLTKSGYKDGVLVAMPMSTSIIDCFINSHSRSNHRSSQFGGTDTSNTKITGSYSTGYLWSSGDPAGDLCVNSSFAMTNCYASNTRNKAVLLRNDRSVPYDSQELGTTALSNPKTTADLTTPDTAKTIVPGNGWVYTQGLYPQIKAFAENANPYIRANSKISALPLPLAGKTSGGKNVSAQAIGIDLALPQCMPGETGTTIKWTADKTGVLSADGKTILGSTAAEGEYLLTATYTEPGTGASAKKIYGITVARATPITGTINIQENTVVQLKWPLIQLTNDNTDKKGTFEIYNAKNCEQVDGKWQPKAGQTPVYKKNSAVTINGKPSGSWWVCEFKLAADKFAVGDKFVVLYKPSADDVRTGFLSAISGPVAAIQNIEDGGFKIGLVDKATYKNTTTPIVGRSYNYYISPVPACAQINVCFTTCLVDENGKETVLDGSGVYGSTIPQKVGTTLRLYFNAGPGNQAQGNVYGYNGKIHLDMVISDGETMTGSVVMKAPQYADGIPRTGKRLNAVYDKSGGLPDTGTDGKWVWEYQASGSDAWTAVAANTINFFTENGRPGSYIYTPLDSEGGKYRVKYLASTNGGVHGETAYAETKPILKPVDINGSIALSADVTPPKVNKTTFTATYTNGQDQTEDSTKGVFQWGYISKSGGAFVPFNGRTGSKYTLQAADFGEVTVKGTYLACQYTADTEGQYTGSALRYYSDVTPDQFKPDDQATPVTETVVYKTTDSEIWVEHEQYMAYAAKISGAPSDSDWMDTNNPSANTVELKTEGGKQYAVLKKGLTRNRTYTIYKKYPARTGYTQSGVSAKTATATTQKTALTGSIALSGAPNKNGVLTAKVSGALAGSYTVDWQYKAPGGTSYTGISGSTGIAQGNGIYTFTIDYGKGLANGGTVRIILQPGTDYKTAISKESGVLTDTISIGSESDLTHIGHLCASTGHESCKFQGLSEENQKKHQYKQSADIALSKAYTPVSLTGGGYDGGNKQVSGQKNPLFGDLSNAYLKNLVFAKPVISGTDSGAAANTAQTGTLALENLLVIEPSVTATNRGGALVGNAAGITTIRGCAVLGGSVNGATAGGLIGQAANGTVENNYVTEMTVTGTTNCGAIMGSRGQTDPSNSYYEKQTMIGCTLKGTGAMGSEANISGLTSAAGLTGINTAGGYTVREGFYPLPAGLSGNSYGKLYSIPVRLQNNETVREAKTMIPLAKQYADGTAVTYTVSDGGKLVDNDSALWLYKPDQEVTVTVKMGSLSRTSKLTVGRGEASRQSVTVKAVETGKQSIDLTTPVYDITWKNSFTSGSGLSQDTELPGKVNTYGSDNANSKVYVELPKNAAGLHHLEITNAAAYTNTESKTVTLMAYRDAAKMLYDTVTVTIEPMETRTLDITVPVGSVEINPNTADRNTESVSGGLSVTNGGKSPVNVSLTGMSPDSGAGKVTLTVNKIDGVDWAKTRESVEEAGIGVKLENEAGKTQITERAYDPSLGSGNGEFATLGYQGKASYRMRVYHPKLAVKDASFGFTMTYRVQVSPQDVEPQSPAAS